MTQFPTQQYGNNPQHSGFGISPGPPGMIAPGREIVRVIRKTLPNGRTCDFTYVKIVKATPQGTYRTWELVHGPRLDCPCTPVHPDDITACVGCNAIVCVRRHSATCRRCGKVFCSLCLEGVTTGGIRVICCEPCAHVLTGSLLGRLVRKLKEMVWG
jgi:hypothetical protein